VFRNRFNFKQTIAMTTLPAPASIRFSDLLRFRFWVYLTKAIWLFFPAVIFLVAVYASFWKLTQGKDLMVITLENRDVFLYFLLAQIFWSYVTWYSSRLVAKAKEFEQPCDDDIWTTLRVQGPRLLAFTSFTIIILAFLQLSSLNKLPHFPGWLCSWLLVLSLPFYFFVYNRWDRFTNKIITQPEKRKFLKKWQLIAWMIIAAGMAGVIIFKSFAGLIVLLLVFQQVLVLLLVIRRKLIDSKGESFYQQKDESRGFDKDSNIRKKSSGILLDKEDRGYFKFFIVIGLLVGTVYAFTVFCVRFSVMIGSFPFVFIAFGFLLLLGNTVAFFSVLKHFNFHIILVGVAFIIGHFLEPHYVQLTDKKDKSISFHQRQNLKEYFIHWINDPERKKQLEDSSIQSYPVFLALADGGASRSGYWVASVLSKLEDSSRGNFSQHLFCLSGASGGSAGNAAFFSLLRSKDQLLNKDTTGQPYYHAATEYLQADFLTFTLARMLGPDVMRHILPLRRIDDRAAALAHALETASGKRSFLYDSLAVPFSQIITQKNQAGYHLPVLCINTTRMQDASPAVISNIDLSDNAFNKRVDVLNLLNEEKDMKLSSAVVLGASFPYVSPAGRIDTKVVLVDSAGKERTVTEPQYFVDGGYFDNSGAGVVNEMLIVLRRLLSNDPLLNKYAAKLHFFILHISNDPVGNHLLPKVNPFINDLATPLKTLVGSFGSQTALNDHRLENYMKDWYGNDSHYININLYRPHETIDYSMNWVISGYLLNAMQQRLQNHEKISTVLRLVGNSQ
jgi:Patatin-like phospholipase